MHMIVWWYGEKNGTNCDIVEDDDVNVATAVAIVMRRRHAMRMYIERGGGCSTVVPGDPLRSQQLTLRFSGCCYLPKNIKCAAFQKITFNI
ncbi:Nuclear hormone receptor [Dirofilaria immitis]